MKKTVIPDHIVGWFEKLKKNIYKFQTERYDMTKNEQVEFIRRQYVLLEIILSVLDDEMQFIGVRQDNIKKIQE